jgi:hypothetical protein
MARTLPCADKIAAGEEPLLARLLGLYGRQMEVYQRILELSRQQGVLVRRGASLPDVRRILQEKRECLDQIAALDRADGGARALWRQGHHEWSAGGRARIHQLLQEVGALIEEILVCEEENDRCLLEHVSA